MGFSFKGIAQLCKRYSPLHFGLIGMYWREEQMNNKKPMAFFT